MLKKKITFALYFANRGFFPESLIAGARADIVKACEDAGFDYLMPPEDMSRYGAIETAAEGRKYAAWLKSHEGEYDGVVMSLPNFGDENGAVPALIDAGVPIFIQAYPDEFGLMDFAHRRDSYCGKFSIMDMFNQYNIPFTVFEPFVVNPRSDAFAKNLRDFAGVCRVVKGMKRFTLGAIGARTTAFKTVRYDELALQKIGCTVESYDLTHLIARMNKYDGSDAKVMAKTAELREYADCSLIPAAKLEILSKMCVSIEDMIEEYKFDCLAIRCWTEMQELLGVAPCLLLSYFNEKGIAAGCEMDVCNAVVMRALSLASEESAMCLDWNNNYGDDPNKVILFHCGPIAASLMEGKGTVKEHLMFAKSGGAGCGWGTNEGRIAACPMTFASAKTENGRFSVYFGEGRITGEKIEEGYFGCAGVAEIDGLQQKLIKVGRSGFRHHTTATPTHVANIIEEAFKYYLGYDIVDIG